MLYGEWKPFFGIGYERQKERTDGEPYGMPRTETPGGEPLAVNWVSMRCSELMRILSYQLWSWYLPHVTHCKQLHSWAGKDKRCFNV